MLPVRACKEASMKTLALATAITAALLATAMARAQTHPAKPASAGSAAAQSAMDASVTQLANNPADWPMPGKNYAGTRFSGLNQIDANNVGNLTVAWTFSTGVLRGHEAAPIVVGDTMYVVTPWPDILYALDLSKDGAIKWVFKPYPSRASQGVACCDVVNRGVAYSDGKIFMNTLDDHTIAVRSEERRVGKECRSRGSTYPERKT